MKVDEAKPGDRVEVLLHRGEADVWHSGTVLAGGGVSLDEPDDTDGSAIVNPEAIAEWRLQPGQSSA